MKNNEQILKLVFEIVGRYVQQSIPHIIDILKLFMKLHNFNQMTLR